MATFSTLLFVIFGGGVGAMSRFAIQEIFTTGTRLPGWAAIFVANMIGCFIIGFGQIWLAAGLTDATIAGTAAAHLISEQNIHHGMAALLVGFCGGLTTFSTFSLDNVFLSHGKFGQLTMNIFGSVLIGMVMAALGMSLAHQWVSA